MESKKTGKKKKSAPWKDGIGSEAGEEGEAEVKALLSNEDSSLVCWVLRYPVKATSVCEEQMFIQLRTLEGAAFALAKEA